MKEQVVFAPLNNHKDLGIPETQFLYILLEEKFIDL